MSKIQAIVGWSSPLTFFFAALLSFTPYEAEAQLESPSSDDPITSEVPPPSGGEISCVSPPSPAEIHDTIEKVRVRLRELGNLGLKPLWDDIIKKWLEGIGAKDLPGGFGLLCSSDKTLRKIIESLNGRVTPPTRGVIDDYFAPSSIPNDGVSIYDPTKLPHLRDLIEKLRNATDSESLRHALDEALALIDKLIQVFNLCGPPAPESQELLRKLFTEFKRLIENLILRPAEKRADTRQAIPMYCLTPTLGEPALM